MSKPQYEVDYTFKQLPHVVRVELVCEYCFNLDVKYLTAKSYSKFKNYIYCSCQSPYKTKISTRILACSAI